MAKKFDKRGRNRMRRTKWVPIEQPDELASALKDSDYASAEERKRRQDEQALNDALKRALGGDNHDAR